MDWHSFLVGYICGYATVLTIWWIYVITEKRRIRILIEEEEQEREGHAESKILRNDSSSHKNS